MTIAKAGTKKLKKRLLREHRKIGSWRRLAERYKPIRFGTLQRFATDPDYVPGSIILLTALGLKKPRQTRAPWYPAIMELHVQHIKSNIDRAVEDTKREIKSHGMFQKKSI